MPLSCQLVKPLCFVTGVETHTGLGLTPTPPPVPCPNPATVWASFGTTCLTPLGDWMSPDVFGDDCGLVKRGSDTKYFRPHISLFSSPLPSVVPPISDLGLIAMHIAFGSSKTFFGPFSVQANIGSKTDNPAVIMVVPTMFLGPANHHLCSVPVRMPSVLSIQVPNSVFAGMTWGDVLGSLALYAASTAIGWVIGKIIALGPVKRALDRLSEAVSKWLSPAIIRAALERIVRVIITKTTDIMSVLEDIERWFTQNTIDDVLENALGIPALGGGEQGGDEQGGGEQGGGEQGGGAQGGGEQGGAGNGSPFTPGWSSAADWVAKKVPL